MTNAATTRSLTPASLGDRLEQLAGRFEREGEGDSHQIWRIQIIQVIAIDIHGTKGGKRQVRPHESPGFVSD